MTPLLSAIICTHNRDRYLGAAIDSLLAQEFDDFEVLVVDNGSRDRTREVVEQRLPHPKLQYIWEPVLGLSVARNTGAQNARAPVLAYLDDDAEASPQWLRVVAEAYQKDDLVVVAGGKVTLLWPEGVTAAPPWLSVNLSGCLGAYDLGDRVLEIDDPGRTPRGLNYSIRRDFLDRIGGFDPNLGRVGKKLLSNEELYVTERALQEGKKVLYLPDALVAHNVAPERLNPSWFMRRGWWQGVSEAYREKLAGRASFLAQFLHGTENIARGLYKSLKYIRDPAERFDNFVYAYGQIGYLSTAFSALRSPPPAEK